MENNENGFVLITVMMAVMLLSVMVLGLISITKLASQEVITNNMLTTSAYESESVANHINYLLRKQLTDKVNRNNKNNNLTFNPNNILSTQNQEIKIGNQVYCYRVLDAAGGLDFSRSNPSKALNILNNYHNKKNKNLRDSMKIMAIVKDYTDIDDFLTTNGAEFANYSANELNLPRNSRMVFRNEVLFIPEIRKLFNADEDGRLTMVKLIAPKGMRGLGSRRNIANANVNELQYLMNFSKNQSEGILRRLQENQQNNFNNFSSSFTPSVANKLRANYGSRPSGIYTIKVWKKSTKNSLISRNYFVTEALRTSDLKRAAKTKKRQLYEALSY